MELKIIEANNGYIVEYEEGIRVNEMAKVICPTLAELLKKIEKLIKSRGTIH